MYRILDGNAIPYDLPQTLFPPFRYHATNEIMVALAFRENAGVMIYIYPSLDPNTRTAKVRFEVPNPTGRLKPEMFADVEIKARLGVKLAVPEGAIIDTGLRQMAIIDKGSGYFERREVKVGAKVDNYYEVIKGLKAGEKVITSANFLIDSESRLKEAVGGMAMPVMVHAGHGK